MSIDITANSQLEHFFGGDGMFATALFFGINKYYYSDAKFLYVYDTIMKKINVIVRGLFGKF